MAKVIFCIFCNSLDVSESKFSAGSDDIRYEYFCHECREVWADDESEFEAGV